MIRLIVSARVRLNTCFCSISRIALVILIMSLICSTASARRRKVTHRFSEPLIKVKLGGLHKKVRISFPKGGVVKNSRGHVIRHLRANQDFKWEISKRRRIHYRNQILQFQGKTSFFKFNSRKYRGTVFVKFESRGATVVNHLRIENYVRGVVGCEIGSRSPAESLKAQAVIARTYAYANKNRHSKENADVCDSNHCQVYNGIKAERESINKAVDATKGIVMISEGKLISPFYFATCGGETSDNDKVWGGKPRSYLRRVKCPFCRKGTNYRWTRSYSIAELKKKLHSEKISFNKLLGVSFKAPSHFDRVDYVLLKTDRGDFKVKGTTFRRLFKLPSTTFLIAPGFKISYVKKKRINTGVAKIATATNNKRKAIHTANLSPDIEQTPRQFALYSGKGLQRVIRPAGGWKVIVYRKLKPLIKESTKKSGKIDNNQRDFVKIERIESLTPKINRKEGLKKIELYGRGYGHQVGLCQSGAIEMGRENWSYRQILAYYYSNVALRHLKY